jgi:hypothetical protein
MTNRLRHGTKFRGEVQVHGYPEEQCFLEGFLLSPLYPSGESNMEMNISTEHWL